MSKAPANGIQASSVIDSEATTSGDEKVGSVSDLLIDENGQVVAIVVGVDGLLDLSQKNVAVEWNDVKRSQQATNTRPMVGSPADRMYPPGITRTASSSP